MTTSASRNSCGNLTCDSRAVRNGRVRTALRSLRPKRSIAPGDRGRPFSTENHTSRLSGPVVLS